MYRYITPDPVASATGTTAAVFAQSRRELGAPFAPHLAAAPDLHAATWALLRESLLAGQAPRARKEAVALAVAVANDCAFCIDAHGALLHAAGAHGLARAVLRGESPPDPDDATVVAWASNPALPPPEPAAEYLGTLLVNHFVTRMTDALHSGSMLRLGSILPVSPLRRIAGAALARRVRRPVPAGESLKLIGSVAVGDDFIGTAYAAFRTAAHRGGELLSEPSRRALIDGRAGDADPAFRLAQLTATAPHRLTDDAVAAWRGAGRTDEQLVRLLAFGAITAVDRIATGVTPVPEGH